VNPASYTVSWKPSPSWRVCLPVPPFFVSTLLSSSPYQYTPFVVLRRNVYLRIVGFAGARTTPVHIEPRRRIFTLGRPDTLMVALRTFAPVTLSRSVTLEPVGTAPNGCRYAELKESWKSFGAASAVAGRASAAASTTRVVGPLDRMDAEH
jgi:hypothetical protein